VEGFRDSIRAASIRRLRLCTKNGASPIYVWRTSGLAATRQPRCALFYVFFAFFASLREIIFQAFGGAPARWVVEVFATPCGPSQFTRRTFITSSPR
jgi:hypothetical protein